MPDFFQKSYRSFKNKNQIRKWNKRGQTVPVPHAIRQQMILKYRDKYNIRTLVESGTYLGDMVWAQQDNFDEIFSIELSKEFVDFSRSRFKKKPHIKIIQGDSGKIMPIVIKEVKGKTIFWLDGHYSGEDSARGDKDCPAAEEVKAIIASEYDHVILINDARNFTGQRDYPSKEGLCGYVHKIHPESVIKVENDCIVIEIHRKREQPQPKEEAEHIENV